MPPSVPNGGSTEYVYNRDRQLTRVLRAGGSTIDLSYDGAGRMSAFTTSRGEHTLGYHAVTGMLTSIETPEGSSLMYEYDGTLPLSMQAEGEVVGRVAWNYDQDLAVSEETVCRDLFTDCQTTSFTYDDDKLLTSAGALTLTRNPGNSLLTEAALGATSETWEYDTFAETSAHEAKFDGQTLFREEFERDALGRIAAKMETANGATVEWEYAYDLTGRLTDVRQNGTQTAHYDYDQNGNRLAKVSASGTETSTCDGQDRMVFYGGVTYSYAPNGELESTTDGAGTSQFIYDELGNLIQVRALDARVIDYIIDGQNRRVGRKVDSAMTHGWLYGNQLGVVAEIGDDGEIGGRFVYGTRTNVPDMMVKGGVTYRIISDQLGSPRFVVNTSTGAVAQQLDYDEFGNVTGDSNPGFQPFGFAGGLYDRDTGLIRFGARDYDPRTGRWTAQDPIRFGAGSPNIYQYCDNDPINWIDPDGLNNRKPGKTPNSSWPKPHENVVGKKPRWNSEGYWEGKGGRRCTWDSKSHGAGMDHGEGEQGGHWDDETSDNRWDVDGNLLPGSDDSSKRTLTAGQIVEVVLVIGSAVVTVMSRGSLRLSPAGIGAVQPLHDPMRDSGDRTKCGCDA